MEVSYSDHMTKDKFIRIIKKLLGTDPDLDFLSKLTNFELETLVAVLRARIEHPAVKHKIIDVIYYLTNCNRTGGLWKESSTHLAAVGFARKKEQQQREQHPPDHERKTGPISI